jgi:hypothetical protein
MNTGAVEGYVNPVTYKIPRTAHPSTASAFIPGFFDDVSCE